MPVLDAHTHILPPDLIARRDELCRREPLFERLYADPRARIASGQDLLAEIEAEGVDLAVTFGFAFRDPGLCRVCNDHVLDLAARNPDRIVPLAVLDPTKPAGIVEARRCIELGARGIGEIMPLGQGFALVDDLEALMDLGRAEQRPILIHINEQLGHAYPGKADQGPREAWALARRYPENVLVLAHWGGGLPFYELMPDVRHDLRNTYYDTAASPFLYDERIYASVMSWAPTKVLFGSDYPLLRVRRYLDSLRHTGLSDHFRARLLYGNAARVYLGAEEGA